MHPTLIDSTIKQSEFNILVSSDNFDSESNSRRFLIPKFDSNGVDDAGPLQFDFSKRKLRAKHNDTLQV